MATTGKVFGTGVAAVVFSGILCCSSGPAMKWWARDRSRSVVGEMTGVPVARACLDADGEGGRWYFAVTEPLRDEELVGLDERLSRGVRLRRECAQPIRGAGNPTARDAPVWFDWQRDDSTVVDRCRYSGMGYFTELSIRSDGAVLIARLESTQDQPGWPAADEVSVVGLFCD